jgi:hypothetical protein
MDNRKADVGPGILIEGKRGEIDIGTHSLTGLCIREVLDCWLGGHLSRIVSLSPYIIWVKTSRRAANWLETLAEDTSI